MIKIAILGLGTVGTGVVKVVEANTVPIQHKLGQPLSVKTALVRKLRADPYQHLMTENFREIEHDGEIRVTGAHVIMESRSHLVEPVTVRPVQPRGGVRFAAGERGLAAEQHLAAANQTGRIRLTLCRQHGIAAPAHMHRIDLAMLEPEAGLARGKQQRGVKTWAPRHRALLEASFGQRLPLRAAGFEAGFYMKD